MHGGGDVRGSDSAGEQRVDDEVAQAALAAGGIALDHVTSKWGVLVLLALQQESLRWGELRRSIEGISEKSLASTLRSSEADGFVHREAHASIPPRVDYSLTDRGQELALRLVPLMD